MKLHLVDKDWHGEGRLGEVGLQVVQVVLPLALPGQVHQRGPFGPAQLYELALLINASIVARHLHHTSWQLTHLYVECTCVLLIVFLINTLVCWLHLCVSNYVSNHHTCMLIAPARLSLLTTIANRLFSVEEVL